MALLFACCPHLLWVRDMNGVLVVDRHTLRWHWLCGVEAAVWRWVSLSYPVSKLTELLALLVSTSPANAHDMLLAMLERWTALGLLEAQAGDDHD